MEPSKLMKLDSAVEFLRLLISFRTHFRNPSKLLRVRVFARASFSCLPTVSFTRSAAPLKLQLGKAWKPRKMFFGAAAEAEELIGLAPTPHVQTSLTQPLPPTSVHGQAVLQVRPQVRGPRCCCGCVCFCCCCCCCCGCWPGGFHSLPTEHTMDTTYLHFP